jgi:hypothetical protein
LSARLLRPIEVTGDLVPDSDELKTVRWQALSGMLGVTAFGLLFTPAFYTIVRKIGRKDAKTGEQGGQRTHTVAPGDDHASAARA